MILTIGMRTPKSQLEAMQRYRKKRGKRLALLDLIIDHIKFGEGESFKLYVGENLIFPDPEKQSPRIRSILGLPKHIDPADYEIWEVTRLAKKGEAKMK